MRWEYADPPVLVSLVLDCVAQDYDVLWSELVWEQTVVAVNRIYLVSTLHMKTRMKQE